MTESGPPVEPERESDETPSSRRSRLGKRIVPEFIRRSYALKIAIALLVVLLLIAGIGGASYYEIQEIIEEDSESTLRSTASVQSAGLAEWIAGMKSQTRSVAASDVYGTQNRERIREHLENSQQLSGTDVASAHYVDDGQIVASTESSYGGSSVSTAAGAWATPIDRTTGGAPGSVATSATYERNGELLLAFVRSVSYGDGVVVVVADARRGFDRLHDAETVSTTTVFTEGGSEVTAPRDAGTSALADDAAFQRALAGETAIQDGNEEVVAFASVDGIDWIVAAEASTGELYQASETVGENVVVLIASALVALAGVGIVIGRGTVFPLIRLRNRAEALEEGTFDVDLRTDRVDEIGRLFVAFAGMRDALREQIRETEAERDRAERSRNEIARQNERLDQFASTLSHDLRNPLNVAEGHRQLLLDHLEEDVDPEVASEHVAVIGESHERMAAIIEDVLELARKGASIENPIEADLESIATEAWGNVDHGEATLSVVGTRQVAADRNRLLRAFENLYRNALEHGVPEDGDRDDVTIEVGATEDGFYVADDGVGIPPDAVEAIFEYGHTTAADGTGFGLAIVEAIVSAHGWEIAVDERYEDGAKFVVSNVDGDSP